MRSRLSSALSGLLLVSIIMSTDHLPPYPIYHLFLTNWFIDCAVTVTFTISCRCAQNASLRHRWWMYLRPDDELHIAIVEISYDSQRKSTIYRYLYLRIHTFVVYMDSLFPKSYLRRYPNTFASSSFVQVAFLNSCQPAPLAKVCYAVTLNNTEWLVQNCVKLKHRP